jgi:hypothetical protein
MSMKRYNQADLLRNLADEDDNILTLWKKNDGVGCNKRRITGTVFCESSNLSWRNVLPDLKYDDLQGFPIEEISKSEVLDMVCAMRSFENVNEENTEEWLQSDACKLGYQHMTDKDTVNAAMKEKGEEGGEDESEEGKSSEHFSHSMALKHAVILLDYMGQRGFK